MSRNLFTIFGARRFPPKPCCGGRRFLLRFFRVLVFLFLSSFRLRLFCLFLPFLCSSLFVSECFRFCFYLGYVCPVDHFRCDNEPNNQPINQLLNQHGRLVRLVFRRSAYLPFLRHLTESFGNIATTRLEHVASPHREGSNPLLRLAWVLGLENAP